jgi:hypothetical protein
LKQRNKEQVMKAKDLNAHEAPNKWWATRDAAQRSYAASTHYAESQKVQAERMKMALGLVYSAKQIFVTFRQKFVAIKVNAAMVKDSRSLKLLESDWEQLGVTKLISAQGVTYRLPKTA